MNSLVGLGATASFAVSAVAALLPKLGEWQMLDGTGSMPGWATMTRWLDPTLSQLSFGGPLQLKKLTATRPKLPCPFPLPPGWRTFFEELSCINALLTAPSLHPQAGARSLRSPPCCWAWC